MTSLRHESQLSLNLLALLYIPQICPPVFVFIYSIAVNVIDTNQLEDFFIFFPVIIIIIISVLIRIAERVDGLCLSE